MLELHLQGWRRTGVTVSEHFHRDRFDSQFSRWLGEPNARYRFVRRRADGRSEFGVRCQTQRVQNGVRVGAVGDREARSQYGTGDLSRLDLDRTQLTCLNTIYIKRVHFPVEVVVVVVLGTHGSGVLAVDDLDVRQCRDASGQSGGTDERTIYPDRDL
ncbi:hypothetical protein D3C84_724980 [compost metagenome]